MLGQIVGVLLPVVFVLALGFGAGKAKAFGKDGVAALSELVLDFALPASLFASTVIQSRQQILGDAGLFLALLIGFTVVWVASFVLAKVLFHHDTPSAAMQALTISSSAAPFFGPAIASDFFGGSGTLAVAVCALVLNIVIVPLTTVALGFGDRSAGTSVARTIGKALLATIRAPYVWAPLLAVILVLVGVRLPALVVAPVRLIGSATSGAALFVAGLSVAAATFALSREVVYNSIGRVVVVPLVVAGLAVLFSVSHEGLQEVVVLAALPTGSIAVLLANRYHHYQSEASSTLAITSVALVVVLPVLVLVLGLS